MPERRGRKHDVKKSPQERLLVSLQNFKRTPKSFFSILPCIYESWPKECNAFRFPCHITSLNTDPQKQTYKKIAVTVYFSGPFT
jgi:hypothetical protein